MTLQYTIAIGEFSVAQANALSDGVFLSAVPPLTAWVGLATKLDFRLGEQITINGIAPVIGEANLHPGHPKYVRYRGGSKKEINETLKKLTNKEDPGDFYHPTIDDRRTSFNTYLLLDVNSEEEIQTAAVEQALIGLRLAGGVIQPVNGRENIVIKLFYEDKEMSSLDKALRYLPSYFYCLEDASHLVQLAREQTDGLQGFDILTAPLRRWADDESKDELKLPERTDWLPTQGYYRPMAVGYQLLEEPQQRLGTRESIDGPTRHAFAEPVFTLVRFRTVASIRKTHSPRNDGSYFWQQGERAENVLGACSMPLY